MALNGNSNLFILATNVVNGVTLLLRNVQQGQAPNVVQINGGTAGDLFVMAATRYGDVSLGFALAQANGLITPELSAELTYQIVLPPLVAGS